jgi:hypothetical protein
MRYADEKLVDDWLDKYKPIGNHIGDSGGWIINDIPIMFETFGPELEFVKSQPPNNVWTWMDGDEGSFISAGMGYVNRIGYFVTKEPWIDMSEEVQIDYYDDEADDEAV